RVDLQPSAHAVHDADRVLVPRSIASAIEEFVSPARCRAHAAFRTHMNDPRSLPDRTPSRARARYDARLTDTPLTRSCLRLAVRAAPFLLALSCKVGRDYERPEVHLPANYGSADANDAEQKPLAPDWWTVFGESELDELETAAIQANHDLRAAAARVVQARA